MAGGPPLVSTIPTGSVDVSMGSYETAHKSQEEHCAFPLVGMNKFRRRLITHVIFARQELVSKKPL